MILTVGHSTRSQDEFKALLKAHSVDVVADIRSHPTSKWPWFNQSAMFEWLPGYVWWPNLGGWKEEHAPLADKMAAVGVDVMVYCRGAFPKQRIGKRLASDPLHPAWTSQGLYDYQWFMTLPEFRAGADDLIQRFGQKGHPNAAIMCSEALWWKCHRSMVADYLWYKGQNSYHIMDGKRRTLHDATNRIGRYDQRVIKQWGRCSRR